MVVSLTNAVNYPIKLTKQLTKSRLLRLFGHPSN